MLLKQDGYTDTKMEKISNDVREISRTAKSHYPPLTKSNTSISI